MAWSVHSRSDACIVLHSGGGNVAVVSAEGVSIDGSAVLPWGQIETLRDEAKWIRCGLNSDPSCARCGGSVSDNEAEWVDGLVGHRRCFNEAKGAE
jgi:hypothetical protein